MCVKAVLTYLCNYFFEGCDQTRGVPRPICRNDCVDLIFASDCANVFYGVKFLGLPTLASADFDCVVTGFSGLNTTAATSASSCVDIAGDMSDCGCICTCVQAHVVVMIMLKAIR